MRYLRKGRCIRTKLWCDFVCSCILPIGLLFAGTLWMGNAAYLYLSVSFIQMLKASVAHQPVHECG